MAPGAETVAIETVVEGRKEADEVGEKKGQCNAYLEKALAHAPSTDVHRREEDKGSQQTDDEATEVSKVVHAGEKAERKGEKQRTKDHEQLAPWLLDQRPILDEIDQQH